MIVGKRYADLFYHAALVSAGKGILAKIVVPLAADDSIFSWPPTSNRRSRIPARPSRDDKAPESKPFPSSSMVKCNVPSDTPITMLTCFAPVACFAILVRPSWITRKIAMAHERFDDLFADGVARVE